MTPPFPLPVLFTAWEWHNGAGIAGKVIAAAKRGGFKTVAVELSEDTGGDPSSTLDVQDVQYLKDAGLFVVGWGAVASTDFRKLSELGLDGWLPQVEGPGQRDALITALHSGAPSLPRALVTTYGGLDTQADVAALVKAWGGMPFTFVETYKADGPPHDDADRMLSQGVVYGFNAMSLVALVGTYRGEQPSEYSGLRASNYGGIYLEENTNDAQLDAFAALAKTPPPPPPPEPTVTNDADKRKADIVAIVDEWQANFGPQPLSRLGVIELVAKSGPEWYAYRQDVIDALGGKVAELRAELADAQAKIERAKTALG